MSRMGEVVIDELNRLREYRGDDPHQAALSIQARLDYLEAMVGKIVKRLDKADHERQMEEAEAIWSGE